MSALDPIIAVKDVQASASWYNSVLGCKAMHGGDEFEILTSEQGEVMLCLHKWGAHDHPSMIKPHRTPGNGLILYFRTKHLQEIRENFRRLGGVVEEEIHLNPNSRKMEFSMRDLDGYFLTISDHHLYEG
ncbi:MAG: glyoxalase [Saprospiraceae bacterium]|nr:glyoxalase [Saprospiraceae bacterium]